MNPRLNSRLSSITILLSVFLFQLSGSVGAAQLVKSLTFPSYCVGNLFLVKERPVLEANVRGTFWKEAKGVIQAPAKASILFEPNGRFFEHPECILRLPPDSIEYLRLQFTSMEDREESMCDRAVVYIHHLSKLKVANLDKSDTTDKGAAKLSGLQDLEAISGTGSQITGTCLASLIPCKNLKFIRFGSVHVNNEQLRYLKEFPKLKRLTCKRVSLNNTGVSHIGNCTNLINLDISENSYVDDASIPFIKKLTALKELNLFDTKISFKGLMQLKGFQTGLTPPRLLSSYSRDEQLLIAKTFPSIKQQNGVPEHLRHDVEEMFLPRK